MKVIKKYFKNSKGSISMMVMIIGVIIVIAVSSMTAVMLRNINYTKLDEDKLRALNIAEAGISDIFTKISKYYSDEIDDLPSNPYESDVVQDGETQGSYYVNYMEFYDDGEFAGYDITSTGTDISGATRTIRVLLTADPGSSTGFNILEYVYSEGRVSLTGSYDITIDGPFYVANDLKNTGSTSINSGPTYVAGDMTITGSSTRVGFPIVVGGDYKITGSAWLYTYEPDPLLAIMGDFTMTGSSIIGLPTNLVELYVGGEISQVGSSILYTYDSAETYVFDKPVVIVDDYVDDVYDEINGNALIIDSDLIIKKGDYFDYTDGTNSISFNKVGGNYILEIYGNVIINGELIIGENLVARKQYTINYEGKGIIYAKDDITIYSKLKPIDVNTFPDSDLLTLVTETDMDISMREPEADQNSNCSDADIYMIGIASGDIDFKRKYATVKGTLIGGTIDFGSGSGVTNVCYEEGILEALPDDLPTNTISIPGDDYSFIPQWQDVGN